MSQAAVEQRLDESLKPGLLMGAEAESWSSRWFRSENNSERSTNARLKLLE